MTDARFHTQVDNPAEYTFESVACYYCGSEDHRFFLIGEDDLTARDGQFQYVQCKQCELVYQHPRLVVDQIKSFYDNEYIAHRKERNFGIFSALVQWTMDKQDRVKDRIAGKYLRLDKDSEVLDVGCAVGSYLLYLQKKYDCKIAGVDFKEDLSFPGFEKIDFYQGLFYESPIREERFDLVTMWHFLEHDYDPNASLRMAARVMKQEGRLLIEVPRLDSLTFRMFGKKWPGVQAPQHTALYSKKNLLEMVEKNGFRVVKFLPYGAFPPFFYIFAGAYFRLHGKGFQLRRILFYYILAEIIMTPFLLFHRILNLSMQTVICEKTPDEE